MPEEVKNKIKIIEGLNNILLIAPHGYPGDDELTAELTFHLQKELKCSAIVNQKFQRTKYDRKNKKWPKGREPIDPKIPKVDLNFIPQINEADLKENWLDKIDELKEKIVCDYDNCFVFLIHGAKDDSVKNVDPGADMLIGIGLVSEGSDKDERCTVGIETKSEIIRAFNEKDSLKAVFAMVGTDKDGHIYAAWDRRNLNQLFTTKNVAYNDPKVQSIQLEIKKTGFRDTQENIEATAEKLALAIQQMPGVAPAVEQVIAAGKEVATIPAQVEPVSDPEVIQAADKIIEIFHDKISSGLIDVGNMLLKQFVNDNFEAVRARKKGEDFPSILQIHRELESRGIKSISRSWLYNAINVAADSKYIEGKKDKNGKDFFDFHTYRNLSASHKVLLERIKDKDEQKRDLILESSKNDYSFVELKNKIAEVKGLPAPVKKSSVLRVADNPAKLFSGDYDSGLKLSALKAMRPSSRKKLKDKVEKSVERQKQYLDSFKKLANQLDKIPDDGVQKKKKPRGN